MDQPGDRLQMTGQEFYESGLLYFINTTLLWPLGAALRVERKKDGSGLKDKLSVVLVEHPQVIVDQSPVDADHPRFRAAQWIAERLDAMAPDERALALEILRDPNNVAAFVPLDPIDETASDEQ